jgi:hypothetical protein
LPDVGVPLKKLGQDVFDHTTSKRAGTGKPFDRCAPGNAHKTVARRDSKLEEWIRQIKARIPPSYDFQEEAVISADHVHVGTELRFSFQTYADSALHQVIGCQIRPIESHTFHSERENMKTDVETFRRPETH